MPWDWVPLADEFTLARGGFWLPVAGVTLVGWESARSRGGCPAARRGM